MSRGTDNLIYYVYKQVSLSLTVKGERKLCEAHAQQLPSPVLDKSKIFKELIVTEFFMPMIPPTVTAQEHKVNVRKGKPVFYDPAELKAAKQKITAHLSKHSPPAPYTCGVRLIVKWLFPITGEHSDGEYKTTKPDTDNLQKLLKDSMTKCGFWKDDALVASEIIEKFYASHPGIYVKVEEV